VRPRCGPRNPAGRQAGIPPAGLPDSASSRSGLSWLRRAALGAQGSRPLRVRERSARYRALVRGSALAAGRHFDFGGDCYGDQDGDTKDGSEPAGHVVGAGRRSDVRRHRAHRAAGQGRRRGDRPGPTFERPSARRGHRYRRTRRRHGTRSPVLVLGVLPADQWARLSAVPQRGGGRAGPVGEPSAGDASLRLVPGRDGRSCETWDGSS
jgi:hypothetical protein